jgi:hypothetical protein
MQLLQEQLSGCKYSVSEINDKDLSFISTKQDEYVDKLMKDSYATKFIDLMVYLQSDSHPELKIDKMNRIPKKDVREYLGIKSSGNFSNKVLNKTNVISFCEVRGITIDGKYITFNSKVS